jgi:nicotinamidase-related amidase
MSGYLDEEPDRVKRGWSTSSLTTPQTEPATPLIRSLAFLAATPHQRQGRCQYPTSGLPIELAYGAEGTIDPVMPEYGHRDQSSRGRSHTIRLVTQNWLRIRFQRCPVSDSRHAKGKAHASFNGHLRCEFRAEFAPEAGEIVATEHWCSSGFANTDLDLQLKKHAIHRLIVIGLIAHTCIEATVRYAAELGYDVTVVKDATADYSDEMMHAALDINIPNYASAVETTKDIVEAIASLWAALAANITSNYDDAWRYCSQSAHRELMPRVHFALFAGGAIAWGRACPWCSATLPTGMTVRAIDLLP